LIEFTEGVIYKASFPPFLKMNGTSIDMLEFTLYEDASYESIWI